MEAIWAVALLGATLGKLYTRLSMEKKCRRAYFLWFMPKKTLGSIFVGMTLNVQTDAYHQLVMYKTDVCNGIHYSIKPELYV
ncbi:unnamed protein product [Arctogadus glacialis]